MSKQIEKFYPVLHTDGYYVIYAKIVHRNIFGGITRYSHQRVNSRYSPFYSHIRPCYFFAPPMKKKKAKTVCKILNKIKSEIRQ